MSKPRSLVDYAAIRRWIEQRNSVRGTRRMLDDMPELLRVVSDDDDRDDSAPLDLDQISWDELFAEFERSQLALLGNSRGELQRRYFLH